MIAHRAAKIVVYLLVAVVFACGPLARPARAAVTPEQVDAAIDKAKKFLYSQQNAAGIWETKDKKTAHGSAHIWGGYTAIATYALLASGESHQDPRIEKALQFLKTEDIDLVYGLGLRAQVWNLLPDSPEVKKLVKRDADTLIKAINKKAGPLHGLYHYGLAKDGPWQNSTAQYGVLGVWAAEQAGYEVPQEYWEMVDAAWRKNQAEDGGWSYNVPPGPKNPQIITMTAAGVATLFITQDYLHANDGVTCKGNITNDNIENGLAWMARHFGEVGGNTYALYGVERIGVASGHKYFGTVDWYAAGAQALLGQQDPKNGAIDGGMGPVPGTSFALVFLTRGRAPVAINKLEYSLYREGRKPAPGNWNQRPRDVANLVRWTGHNMEHDLNWQVVNLGVSADDIHDAPILYLSGDQDLMFTGDEQAKLKEFVESGGMILGNADCGRQEFTQSFEKLGAKLFGREFRDLSENHVIFTNQQYKTKGWKNKPKVRGLSNEVRELMLLMPDVDAARAWQTRADQTRLEMFQLGADVFLYAVDKKNLRNKGDSFLVREDPAVVPDRTMKVARIQAGENWNPEPGGWRRVAAILHNQFKLGVTVEPIKLADSPLVGYRVAHVTGTTKFKFDADQRARLLEFCSHGGTLIMDAAGGAADFADSAEAELKEIFGADAKKALASPVPLAGPVYDQPGAKVESVGYRTFARTHLVGNMKAPRVYGVQRGNRIVAFYSREDLSCGMVGAPVDGVIGYEPASATAVMRNLLLYAAPKPPAAAPPAAPTPAAPTPAPAPAPGPAAQAPPPAAPVAK